MTIPCLKPLDTHPIGYVFTAKTGLVILKTELNLFGLVGELRCRMKLANRFGRVGDCPTLAAPVVAKRIYNKPRCVLCIFFLIGPTCKYRFCAQLWAK